MIKTVLKKIQEQRETLPVICSDDYDIMEIDKSIKILADMIENIAQAIDTRDFYS